MRIALHASGDRKLVPGEGLDGNPPAFQGDLKGLLNEGLAARYEVKSIEKNAESALANRASAQKAGRYPVVSAFGDADLRESEPSILPGNSEVVPHLGRRRPSRFGPPTTS